MKQVVRKHIVLSVEPHTFHVMWSHTMLALRVYQNRVNDGKDLEAASDFARWLRQIGLVRLFEAHPQPEPLPVDGVAMDAAVSALLDGCAEHWKRGTPRIVDASEIEKLNYKVDVLANALREFLPERARSEVVAHDSVPSLKLLENLPS
jgi:hypothetical protein